jgi:hypothetical protein
MLRTHVLDPAPDPGDDLEARPPTAGRGGVHRRGLLVRIGVWAAIASGPAALVSSCTASAAPRAVVRAVQPATPSTVGPAGFAQMFLSLWLRAGASPDDARAQAVRAMAPGVALLTDAQNAQGARTVEQCVAVRSVQVAAGLWSVVVGVELDSGSAVQLRYFAVPVAVESGEGSGGLGAMTVVAAPAEVGPPTTAADLQTGYSAPVAPGSALAASVSAFLSAYLAGAGELSALLSPGTQLVPLPAAPFAAVQVVQVSTDRAGLGGAVPADGTVAEVLVAVTATDPGGTGWPLQYALRMRARAGRWEVAGLEPGPLLSDAQSAQVAQRSQSADVTTSFPSASLSAS